MKPALVAMVVALLSSCTLSNLDFETDRRVSFTNPPSRATVDLPLRASWTIRDFDVTGPTDRAVDGSGYFVVLVDRPPQPPGKPVAWFARNDKTCEVTPGCPDQVWFADHDIYLVTKNSIALDQLPIVTGSGSRKERHELTVVLVDGLGRRVGETAFTRTIFVQRGSGR